MSYFVFGLADLKTGAGGGEPSTLACLAIERCAAAAGLAVALGGEHEPPMLAEMRGEFSAGSAIPFLCLAHGEEDTSDSLISPHLLGIEGACQGAARIADWAGCVLRTRSVERLRIWFTEGFDSAFERRHCRVEDLAPLLIARLRDENEVPSLLVSIGPQAGSAPS